MAKLTPEEKAEKAAKSKLKSFVIAALRRASYRWPARNDALKAARIRRGVYRCACCAGEFGRKAIKIDHIAPVVSVTEGFEDWEAYIVRMFCDSNGFQILCEICHDAKTHTEKELRKVYRKKRKEQ